MHDTPTWYKDYDPTLSLSLFTRIGLLVNRML